MTGGATPARGGGGVPAPLYDRWRSPRKPNTHPFQTTRPKWAAARASCIYTDCQKAANKFLFCFNSSAIMAFIPLISFMINKSKNFFFSEQVWPLSFSLLNCTAIKENTFSFSCDSCLFLFCWQFHIFVIKEH